MTVVHTVGGPFAPCPRTAAETAARLDAQVLARAAHIQAAGFRDVTQLMRGFRDGPLTRRGVSERWRETMHRLQDRGMLVLSQTGVRSVEYGSFRVTPAGWAAAGVAVPPWAEVAT